MPAKFAGLADRMDDVCDVEFGEAWQFVPMKPGPGGGLPTPDPTRSTRSVVGIYLGEPERSTEFGSEARGSVPRSINKPEVSVQRQQFAPGELARLGDRLVRDDDTIWEISDAPEDSEGRLRLNVKKIG